MEITTQPAGDRLDMKVTGRLDAYWADHLATALEEAVRGGADRIALNLSEVSYMSSVGIRVLLKFYKQLQRIRGSLYVCNPSEPVKKVLELAGLEALLESAGGAERAVVEARAAGRRVDGEHAAFEIFDCVPGASLEAHVIGAPELLLGCRFRAEHCRTVSFPDGVFGIGLGAFGGGFDDCRGRFGEFVAAAGGAAYLPTDGTNVPDYLVSTGAFVPDLKVLYAIACHGPLAHLVRFEAKPESAAGVTLAVLADSALDIVGADAAGMVMVAESAGLMGAALRRSPALGVDEHAPFAHPGIREWLSFTPERAFTRSLVLVVGVTARHEGGALAPLLRPLRSDGPAGHFHAAAFSYRPLQKGEIALAATVSALFEAATLQGVLHLLRDDRALAGAGESEFVRGACWISPIGAIVTERS